MRMLDCTSAGRDYNLRAAIITKGKSAQRQVGISKGRKGFRVTYSFLKLVGVAVGKRLQERDVSRKRSCDGEYGHNTRKRTSKTYSGDQISRRES
jgi:hypothetical protein